MRMLLAVIAIFVTTVSLSACNTVDGAGEDIQAGGNAISRTANEVQHGE